MNKFREFWNKYMSQVNIGIFVVALLTVAAFTFGESSIINRMKYDEKINELEQEIKATREKIKSDSLHLELLNTDPENLEKFAREQYLMKRENEDIFVFDE